VSIFALNQAFNESPLSTRFLRVQASITELGISVLGGVISTCLSVSMLYFSVIVMLRRFAAMTLVSLFFSFLFSNFFFVAFLSICGPSHKTGNLVHYFKVVRAKIKERRSEMIKH
jgi:hypothetical protein